MTIKTDPEGTKGPSPAIWRPVFLETLKRTGNVAASCLEAKVAYSSAYRARGNNQAFRAEWDEAMEIAVDSLEMEAWRRGRDGIDKPVFWQGKQITDEEGRAVFIKEYSDTLLTTLLKAHRPGRFVQTQKIEASGPDGKPLQSEVVISGAVAVAEQAFLTALGVTAAKTEEGDGE